MPRDARLLEPAPLPHARTARPLRPPRPRLRRQPVGAAAAQARCGGAACRRPLCAERRVRAELAVEASQARRAEGAARDRGHLLPRLPFREHGGLPRVGLRHLRRRSAARHRNPILALARTFTMALTHPRHAARDLLSQGRLPRRLRGRRVRDDRERRHPCGVPLPGGHTAHVPAAAHRRAESYHRGAAHAPLHGALPPAPRLCEAPLLVREHLPARATPATTHASPPRLTTTHASPPASHARCTSSPHCHTPCPHA